MPPYRNQLERRSKKYAARQYVSETHDHKPDAPSKSRPRANNGDSAHELDTDSARAVFNRSSKYPIS